MLRKSGLFCAAAFLAWGCDFFTTREFRSKPSDIRALSGLTHAGDSLSFRAVESVWKAGAAVPEKILSSRRLTFTLMGDSLDAGDTLKILSLRIRDDSTGALTENTRRVVRFSSQGVVLEGTAEGGGARYFPLKASASADADAAASDSTSLLAIPGLLAEGWAETRSMGILTVKREQVSIDTLKFQGRLEEAWGIRETVSDGAEPLSTGTYWYGASGLLKAEQTWADFDWRSENGSVPAPAGDGSAAKVELRRTVARL
jgi:hypothetical protein